jgi:hypothetical protein
METEGFLDTLKRGAEDILDDIDDLAREGEEFVDEELLDFQDEAVPYIVKEAENAEMTVAKYLPPQVEEPFQEMVDQDLNMFDPIKGYEDRHKVTVDEIVSYSELAEGNKSKHVKMGVEEPDYPTSDFFGSDSLYNAPPVYEQMDRGDPMNEDISAFYQGDEEIVDFDWEEDP